jgi:hypothetical protein
MQNPDTPRRKCPRFLLIIGLVGIGIFVIGSLSLFPPDNSRLVFFWLVRLYGYIFIPSIFLLPPSILLVTICLSLSMKRLWVRAAVLIIGVISSVVCFFPALGSLFLASFIVGEVKQNDHVYYLVEYYEDRAINYLFCESDSLGFSGQCSLIA